MRLYRRVADLAAVTALSLSAAACGTADAAVTTPAAATPAGKLLAAAPDESTPAFAYSTRGGCSAAFSGVVDGAAKRAQTSVSHKIPQAGSVSMTFLSGEKSSHARFTFKPASLATRLGVPKGWLKIDPAKLGEGWQGLLTFDRENLDPLGVSGLASIASDVAQDGLKFTGTLDLTRIPAEDQIIPAATVAGLGDKAKAVPFEAAVDETTGTVTSWTIKVPSAKACILTYDSFGKTKKLTVPKATKAPSAVYTWLDS